MKKVSLIADVGGTNIRLAVVVDNAVNNLKIYKVKEYKTILDVILLYIKTLPTSLTPKEGIIAVAATIFNNTITMTNINWQFNINELKDSLNFNNLKVINDFEAQALSVTHLTQKDTTVVYKNINTASNNRKLILGPGTGLGVALLLKTNNKWQIVTSEAGHTVIGFYNDIEKEVLNFVAKHLKSEPYAEKLISGNGIVNIYKALLYINKMPPKNNITAEDVYNLLLQKDEVATKTIDLFFSFLGTFVGNCIVSFLPFDGVYLTGGILPKLLPYFLNSGFIDRLENKNLATVKSLIQNTPIYLITAENPALIGLKYFC